VGIVAGVGLAPELLPVLSGRRAVVAWLVGAYLVTFLVTRLITRAIRTGRGPFHDASVGGVHVHHEVYGIFLLLGAGTLEFTYRPGTPWLQVLAVLFGAGAALTLDEFALWLYLDDVYWSEEGRSSVDAVVFAAIIGGAYIVGFTPLDATGDSTVGIVVSVLITLGIVAIVALKGKISTAVIGMLIPPVAWVAAIRLARPGSWWARRRYEPGSGKLVKCEARKARHDQRVRRFQDLVGGAPSLPSPRSEGSKGSD